MYTSYTFTPPLRPSLAVKDSEDRFPVRRIFCVGRNYADHVREMGGDPEAEPPFFFTKPADALVETGAIVPYPPATALLHHEVELVVAIGRGGAGIEPAGALPHVFGYAVGNDLTRRDLQHAAREARRPWDMSKGFDASAQVGPLATVERFGHPGEEAAIWLAVNGSERQKAQLGQMIWPVADIISHLSGLVALAPGDLIFTGTPQGVGPLLAGDEVSAGIDGLEELSFRIAG